MKEGNQPFNAQKALRVACLVLAESVGISGALHTVRI